jgi:hypothetical protein
MRFSTVVRRLERLGIDRARVDTETRVIAHHLDKLLRPLGLEIRRAGHRALPRRTSTAAAGRGSGQARPPGGRFARAEQAERSEPSERA